MGETTEKTEKPLRSTALHMRHEGDVSYYWFSKTDSVGVSWTNGLLRTDKAYFLLEYDCKGNDEARWISLIYLTPCCHATPNRLKDRLTCTDCSADFGAFNGHWCLTRSERYPAVDEREQVQALEAWLALMGHDVFDAVLLASHIQDLVASIVAEPAPLWPESEPVDGIQNRIKHAIAVSNSERSW